MTSLPQTESPHPELPHTGPADAVLEEFFRQSRKRARDVSPSYLRLWESLESSAAGGKRFRPRLVLSAYSAFSGGDLGGPAGETGRENAGRVAAAFELLHTALVVHDDVIDRDFVRRGAPNIAGRYRDLAAAAGAPGAGADHHGASVAVIAGDLALFNAYRMIDTCGLDEELRRRILDLMDEALFLTAAGELSDIEFSFDPGRVEVAEVLGMETLKTAVYSFAAPLRAGAVLARAPERVVALLGDIGRDLGTAYQVVDDLLGIFGDPAETGKSSTGDLRERKRTVVTALAQACREWPLIEAIIERSDLDDRGAERIRELLIAAGVRSSAQEIARVRARRAEESLADPLIPPELRRDLRGVVGAILAGAA